MAINLDRKSPGIIGILFGAFFSVVLGALLAVLHLMAQPVEVLTAEPNERAEGVKYFIKGAPGGEKGRVWQAKFSRITDGSGEVKLSENELNTWAGDSFEEVKLSEEEKASSLLIIAGTPNFRLIGSALQIGTENQLVFFGSEAPLILQATGAFAREGQRWKFVPTEAYLGGLPLHRAPLLMALAAKRFGPTAALPEEVEKLLTQATQIAIADDELVVRMP